MADQSELCHWPFIDLKLGLSYAGAMVLLRGIFWIVLFVFVTFCFVVLFEYGTSGFTIGFQKEFSRIKTFVMKEIGKAEKPKK
jgi:hypothetical protein